MFHALFVLFRNNSIVITVNTAGRGSSKCVVLFLRGFAVNEV